MPLDVDIQKDDGGYRVLLQGDLDLHSAPPLRESLLVALSEERSVTLDLAEVGYMDSSGVALLIFLKQESVKKSTPFCIENLSVPASAVLRALSLESLFGID